MSRIPLINEITLLQSKMKEQSTFKKYFKKLFLIHKVQTGISLTLDVGMFFMRK
jgi:hypothetical protein